ncbi:MAG: hypothetical protein U1F52_12390 [Burkholderiales bacterium]
MLSKIRDAVRMFGPWDGILFLAGQALSRVSGGRARLAKYYIVAQPVPTESDARLRRGGSIEVRRLEPAEVRALSWPRPQPVIERRLAEGAVCMAAFSKGRMIGFQWLSLGPYEEDDVRTRFDPSPAGRAAWDYDIFVDPDHRLGRAFVRLWDATNLFLRERGIPWSMSRISAFAPESRRSHASMEAVRIGTCLYLCVGSLQLSFLSRAPWMHVGFSSARRPVFRAEAPDERDGPVGG